MERAPKGQLHEKADQQGRLYYTLSYHKFDKNHRNRETKDQRMYATDDENCPVQSLDLYLSKLNAKNDALFQKPDPNYLRNKIWDQNAPLGIHTLNNMLKCIFKEAGLATIYTNHSLKVTSATILKNSGVDNQDIMDIRTAPVCRWGREVSAW